MPPPRSTLPLNPTPKFGGKGRRLRSAIFHRAAPESLPRPPATPARSPAAFATVLPAELHQGGAARPPSPRLPGSREARRAACGPRAPARFVPGRGPTPLPALPPRPKESPWADLLRPVAPSVARRPRQGPPRPASSSPRPVLTGPGRGRPESGGSSPGRDRARCFGSGGAFRPQPAPSEAQGAGGLGSRRGVVRAARQAPPSPAGHLWSFSGSFLSPNPRLPPRAPRKGFVQR